RVFRQKKSQKMKANPKEKEKENKVKATKKDKDTKQLSIAAFFAKPKGVLDANLDSSNVPKYKDTEQHLETKGSKNSEKDKSREKDKEVKEV
ncbi:UNVERIFIED_CONTAM: hypothetical protein HDU68_009711, partial [Siphonaria sp. JEL0065]